MSVSVALLDLYDTLVGADWAGMRSRLHASTGLDAERLGAAFETTRPVRNSGTFDSLEEELACVLEAYGAAPEPALVATMVELERNFASTDMFVFEDSLPVLRELRRRGVRTAIVSNCSHETPALIDRLGLADEVDEVVLSFEVRSAKPDPGIYLAALERLGAAAEDAVFIDDQVTFCDGARAVGLSTMLIVRDPWDPPEASPHPVVRDLTALLA
jgi:putative hydrolase of the HAD superfamily